MMRLPDPTRRRTGRLAVTAAGALLLASCSGDVLPPVESGPSTLAVVSPNPHPGVAGMRLPDPTAVRVLDAQGRGVPSAPVHFAVTDGGGTISPASVETDPQGYARATWKLGTSGPQRATVRVGSLAPVQLSATPVQVPPPVAAMLGMLVDYVASALASLNSSAPRNPQLASYYEAKLEVLRRPGIGAEVVEGRRFAEGGVTSRSGHQVPVTAVFALESMRGDAVQSVRDTETALPVLEAFLGTPFPAPTVKIWYGFVLGNSGGGGTLYMEDRATYESRTPASRLPYQAITIHEVAHSYIGNESLTQFLELYGYNLLQTGSADLRTWRHTRGHTPDQDSNEGVHALLDVYQMIGAQAMAAAYRAVLPLRPPYGQPLTAAAQQVFVDAAPAELRSRVAAKMARIRS